MKEEVAEFLKESNAIEGVYDNASLLQAQEAWKFLIKQKELTVGAVLKTHKILMLLQNLYPNEKGYFRTLHVLIGGREGLEHKKIPHAVGQWVLNVNDVVKNGQKENPIFLQRITQSHHVSYEEIHPFVDGNGRTGRIFLNWERLRVGLPILIIKADERS